MNIRKLHPYIYIIFTFFCVILIGTILLLLPISYSKDYINETSVGDYIANSIFMSTSAVCVTGLSVMPDGIVTNMTIFGKAVMVLLMEIGGLSIITIAVFFFSILGGKIGLSSNFILKESLNQNSVNGIMKLVKNIVILSFTIQLIGIFVNWYPIYEYIKYLGEPNLGKAFLMSVFHAAASFNNAGFDVFSADSMVAFSSAEYMNYGISTISMVTINLSTMLMIVFGGIGVVILNDIKNSKFKWKMMSLHTKITLITTLCLIIFGAVLLKLTCKDMNWMEAFFQAITCRTAGFQTYRMTDLSPAGTIVCTFLMIVGASPCSCGGGIKTTTFAIIVLAIVYFSIGKKTKAFNRTIETAQIFKAFVLVSVTIICCLMNTFIVLLIQPELGLDATLFEVVSAFSTTGLSKGITTDLNIANKILLSFLMFFGRLGPLTVIGVVNKNWLSPSKELIKYVEESVYIG